MKAVHALGRFRERARVLGLTSSLAWVPGQLVQRLGREVCRPLWARAGRRSDAVLERLPGRDPEALRRLVAEETGLTPEPYVIDVDGYRAYLQRAAYPRGTYGDESSPTAPFHEKTLEHYVAFDVLQLGADDVFMDVASNLSRVPDLASGLFGARAYRQDLAYPAGLHGDRIGGFASSVPLEDGSLSAITLHCSFEHFEGEEDTRFIHEAARLLRPGGKLVILPLYLAEAHTLVTSRLWGGPRLDDEGTEAALRVRQRESTFTRQYRPARLKERVLDVDPRFESEVLFVENQEAISPSCYLKFVLVMTRREDEA